MQNRSIVRLIRSAALLLVCACFSACSASEAGLGGSDDAGTRDSGNTQIDTGIDAPAAGSCSDSVLNGDETDVDCGGSACDPCAVGQGCSVRTDCESQVCFNAACAAAACDDTVLNGTETDVDCGGDCAPCATGKICSAGTDCEGQVCTAGICQGQGCA